MNFRSRVGEGDASGSVGDDAVGCILHGWVLFGADGKWEHLSLGANLCNRSGRRRLSVRLSSRRSLAEAGDGLTS